MLEIKQTVTRVPFVERLCSASSKSGNAFYQGGHVKSNVATQRQYTLVRFPDKTPNTGISVAETLSPYTLPPEKENSSLRIPSLLSDHLFLPVTFFFFFLFVSSSVIPYFDALLFSLATVYSVYIFISIYAGSTCRRNRSPRACRKRLASTFIWILLSRWPINSGKTVFIRPRRPKFRELRRLVPASPF